MFFSCLSEVRVTVLSKQQTPTLYIIYDIISIFMFFVHNILFLSVGGEGARLVEAADAHLVYYIYMILYNILCI